MGKGIDVDRVLTVRRLSRHLKGISRGALCRMKNLAAVSLLFFPIRKFEN